MKDERILIFKVKSPCSDNCEIKDIQSCKTCNVKKQYDGAVGYDTAIEKMAEAIVTPFFEGVFSCENEAIEEYAKAALKALVKYNK